MAKKGGAKAQTATAAPAATTGGNKKNANQTGGGKS